MNFFSKIFGIRECAVCKETVSNSCSWVRSSSDRWVSFSTNPKVDKLLQLKIKVETKGLCDKCFSDRSVKAIAAAREFFRDAVPAGQKF